MRVVVALTLLAVFGLLFIRSVRSTRAAPFAVQGQDLGGWTLVVQPPGDSLGSWLALSPPPQLPASIGREIFSRGGESVYYPPVPLMPLLLQSEFDRAFAGRVAPEALVNLARTAAFESITWTPRCVGHRRVSGTGVLRGVYFLLLDAPPFDRFRQQLSAMLGASGSGLFDPAAVSPVLIVAGLDGNFSRWMPLRADPEVDCLGPVETT